MSATTSPLTGICSGSGGHGGDLSGVRQRICHPGGVLRRRDRPHFPDQPRHRSGPAGAPACGHLSRQPLCHHQGQDGRAAEEIEKELAERKKWFEDHGKLIEAQRIDQRTRYDLEMMRELGYCTGIENYSRVISGRGRPPRPPPCWTISRRIFCCSWTRAM